MWRGDDFLKDEGDPNYQSVRRDGTRWRGIRDYAETGVTRTFAPAAGAILEASFRYHRIEDHYEEPIPGPRCRTREGEGEIAQLPASYVRPRH